MDERQLILMGLVALAVCGVGYAFVIPYMDGDFRAEKRQQLFSGGAKSATQRQKTNARNTKVADTLKEIERREKGNAKLSLADRIKQAGLTWTTHKFYLISAIIGLALAGAGLPFNPLFALAGLIIGGLGIPAWLLVFLKKRRLNKFLTEFPNAVDVIVRGVKSGLPLGDCLRIIANEASEPVRGEFRAVIEQQTLGLTLPEAVATLPRRVPLQEANFFAIVIEIQSKSGGNLSEILGNLSKVLRDRKKIKGKIQAMSTEAKSSAGIIAALPFVVAILVSFTSPNYIRLLFVTETGKIVLMGCAFMMIMGIAIMKKMISFDF